MATLIESIISQPRIGEVYNIGGGSENSCSIIEAFEIISEITGILMEFDYEEKNRNGDHICYYSDLTKVKNHYPEWKIAKPLSKIFQEIAFELKSKSQISVD